MPALSIASHDRTTKDSLEQQLAKTSDPSLRVKLLLDLKDIHEDTELRMPYAIQLFREAAAIGDTYAMSVGAVTIITRYAGYPEKKDTLDSYIAILRRMTPGTPEEGFDHFAETAIGFSRLADRRTALTPQLARKVLHWCDSIPANTPNIYEQAKKLTLGGRAAATLHKFEHPTKPALIPQIPTWEKAFALTQRMPDIGQRKLFANLIYYYLSNAYLEANNLDALTKLTNNYLHILETYFSNPIIRTRRSQLYANNIFVYPYQQLMRGAAKAGRIHVAENYFATFRKRMISGQDCDAKRSQTYFYEAAYLWKLQKRDYAQALIYCDSLIRHIESSDNGFAALHYKIRRTYQARAQILTKLNRHQDAITASQRALAIQDSLYTTERQERMSTLLRSSQINQRMLAQTRTIIQRRTIASTLLIVIGLLLIASALYLYRNLRRTHRLQADILRHTRKAQESEHMKSAFINTICRGIETPLEMIDNSIQRMMIAGAHSPRCPELRTLIHDNTRLLLATMDNMLEAASLDSLSEPLHVEQVDIKTICHTELVAVQRNYPNPQVTYQTDCHTIPAVVATHAKYFAFVVRALLDNAAKSTTSGQITFVCSWKNDYLTLIVADTGCGISQAVRAEIFQPIDSRTSGAQGLSLALCRLIAERLNGSIRLDEGYQPGARFVFTIPAKRR